MSHTYDHKKSTRIVTEEQFSDETTIDGDRLDSAYADLTDRINDVPKGDIRTRFVQQQYVFGYSPSGIPYVTPTAYTEDSAGHRDWEAYIRSQTRFPWTFIVNNQHTTADPQPRAPDPIPDDYDYPAENYQNRNRYKGTHIDSAHLGQIATPVAALPTANTAELDQALNQGPWANSEWKQSFAGEITAYTVVTPQVANTFWPRVDNHYQVAWSHAWEFSSPVILDDLMLFFRRNSTNYQATFAGDPSTSLAVDQCVIQITVDSPLAPHKREYNSIVVMRHQVDFSKNKVHPMPAPSELDELIGEDYDMMPLIRQTTGDVDAEARILDGRMERLTDLNIPLPAGARVRLAVIIPWFAAQTTADSPDYYHSHWPEVNSGTGWLADDYKNQYGWAGAPPGVAEGQRWESMMDWSLNGWLTVLSEIKS